MKIFLTLLLLLSLIIVSKAQIYTQFDIGYNFPIFEKNDIWTSAKILENNKFNDYHRESVDFNIFSGYYINLNIGYVLKNKFQFDLSFSYFDNYNLQITNNNKTTYDSLNTEQLGYPNPSYYSLIEENYYYSKYFSFNPSIGYIASINKLSFTFILGSSFRYVTIYRDFKSKTKTNISDLSPSTSNNYEYNLLLNEYYPTNLNIVVYSGLSASYAFNNNISLLCSINLPIYSPNITLSDTKTKYYSSFKGYENNELIYDTEETEEETVENKDLFSFNTNTVKLTFGVRYTFSKREKEKIE